MQQTSLYMKNEGNTRSIDSIEEFIKHIIEYSKTFYLLEVNSELLQKYGLASGMCVTSRKSMFIGKIIDTEPKILKLIIEDYLNEEVTARVGYWCLSLAVSARGSGK